MVTLKNFWNIGKILIRLVSFMKITVLERSIFLSAAMMKQKIKKIR